MIVNLAVVILLQSQSTSHIQDGVKHDSKELDAKIRPIVEIPQFKNMKCVTVSAYRWMDKNNKKLEVTRVFRFTYQADFKVEIDKWIKTYAKNGWHQDPDHSLMLLDRDLKHPKVTRQGMILHKGKAVFDAKSMARTRTIKLDGWVWVSLNETIKDPAW